jgi:hypothetical protein
MSSLVDAQPLAMPTAACFRSPKMHELSRFGVPALFLSLSAQLAFLSFADP